jgi:hypothetical protein
VADVRDVIDVINRCGDVEAAVHGCSLKVFHTGRRRITQRWMGHYKGERGRDEQQIPR